MKGMELAVNYLLGFLLMVVVLAAVGLLVKGQITAQQGFLESSIGVLIK